MIQILFGRLDPVLVVQIVAKILLALFLGGLVGLEREQRHRPAGLRTFMLVSVGACIFTILSLTGFAGGDPARVAAQIVTGIGFLGAGVTIHRKGTVYGLTSAAGIWAVAAIGMAVGTSNYFLAIFSTAAVLIVMGLLRRWFKEDVARVTRRTLNTALREVRDHIIDMGSLVEHMIRDAVRALVEDNANLAQQVIELDDQINSLRYRVEEEALDILRTHQPARIELRTVLAATHIVTNIERMGDYAKEIAEIRLQLQHEPLPKPVAQLPAMADQVCNMLAQVVQAFARDDVEAANRLVQQLGAVDTSHDEIVLATNQMMAEKKSRHFERGAYLIHVAHNLKRVGERVINIAERIVFVRTGALEEIDLEE